MNEHFAADIALMASIARVIECDARHNLRPGNLALILPSLRDFRDTVNMMVEKWEARLDIDRAPRGVAEAQQKVNSDLSEAMDRFNARQSTR